MFFFLLLNLANGFRLIRIIFQNLTVMAFHLHVFMSRDDDVRVDLPNLAFLTRELP